jgi:hypothetical protein
VSHNQSEKSLLLAVRDALRTAGSDAGRWTDDDCEVEPDDNLPAIAGDVYVAVIPGGWRPGPRHNTQSGVYDLVYSVDVCVARRIAHVPRDRRRDVFLHNVGAIDELLDLVTATVDWSYTLMAAANALILSETGTAEGFVEPLRFAGVDRRPRLASPEQFAAVANKQPAGMLRTISFGGARRTSHR